MRKVIGVAGFKNAGKTTLVEKLVAELTRRGHRVSTVKHAHHSFDIDHEGRATARRAPMKWRSCRATAGPSSTN
jgi:molybdopterin-guanine dinucleotide biosynthesis protein MobB